MRTESWVLFGAILFYMATCATARAVELELRYQNPGGAAYSKLEVCATQAGGVPSCVELASACAGGAICSARIDLPHGQSIVSARAAAGGPWSAVSNQIARIAVDPARCMASDVCRFDPDENGTVTVGDFGRFMTALGKSWLTP